MVRHEIVISMPKCMYCEKEIEIGEVVCRKCSDEYWAEYSGEAMVTDADQPDPDN